MYPSVRNLLNHQAIKLSSIYPNEESREMVFRLAEYLLGCNRSKLLLLLNEPPLVSFVDKVDAGVSRLMEHEPLQYVVGEVEFYGCTLKVTPSVLIPRPETEELVDTIVKEWKGLTPSVVDFGTGSGCIPIALAKSLPGAVVRSVDISEDALSVARSNARLNEVEVELIHEDMHRYTMSDKVDVIVSNPPYVMSSEKREMRSNVLNYEPHLALFVNDSDPLEFYRPIAHFAGMSLSEHGAVYLEVNQQLANETALLFAGIGMNTRVEKDIFGADRFVVARWAKK